MQQQQLQQQRTFNCFVRGCNIIRARVVLTRVWQMLFLCIPSGIAPQHSTLAMPLIIHFLCIMNWIIKIRHNPCSSGSHCTQTLTKTAGKSYAFVCNLMFVWIISELRVWWEFVWKKRSSIEVMRHRAGRSLSSRPVCQSLQTMLLCARGNYQD